MKALRNIFTRLGNRREFSLGMLYLGAAWILLELAVVLEEILNLPDRVDQITLYVLAAGFPLVLLFGRFLEAHEDDEPTGLPSERSQPGYIHQHAHDNPSIAIMPFRARPDDQIESLTAGGLTDELTTLLTGVLAIKVLPRQAIGIGLAHDSDLLHVARDLHADYMVSGSVRRDKERLRVQCELTDLSDSTLIWSDKFDRAADDLFAIQDEVAKGIVGTMGGMIAKIESFRAARCPPESLKAWELVRRSEMSFDWRPERMAQSVADCQRAVQLDPGYAHAHAHLGVYLSWQVAQGWADDPASNREEALVQAELALRITREDGEIVSAVGEIFRLNGEYEQAVQLYDSARAHNPDVFVSWPFALALLGWAYAQLGQEETGLQYVDEFEKKFPRNDLGRVWTRVVRGYIELCRRNYAEVVVLHANPPSEYNGMCRVIALMRLGRSDEAQADVEKLKQVNPKLSIEHYIEHFKHFHIDADIGAELSQALVELRDVMVPTP